MFTNYIKIAWRNLLRHKSNAIINIAGLATGIAACLLIFMVIQFESGYDTFHTHYNNIYRVVKQDVYSDGVQFEEGEPGPVTAAMRVDFPQLSAITEVFSSYGSQLTIPSGSSNIQKFTVDDGLLFIDTAFFRIFNAQWLAGDVSSLSQPGNVVLDKEHATRYFGQWQQAIGKLITMDNQIPLQVTGVIDNQPPNTDVPLKVLVSFPTLLSYGPQYGYSNRWQQSTSNHQVYVLLPDNVSAASIDKAFIAFTQKYYDKEIAAKKTHFLQPLKTLHFDTRFGNLGDHTTSRSTLLTLAFIGFFIVLMASINFVNLSTAQTATRAKEIGVRKVLGSNRRQIMAQVMSETTIIVCFALLLAVGIAAMVRPYLSQVSLLPSSLHIINSSSLLFLIATGVAVILLSGLYPSLVLSGFRPVEALRSKMINVGQSRFSMRRVLVVTQFAISQILIIGTIVAIQQMNFVRNADLGYNKDAILLLDNFTDSVSLQKMATLQYQLQQTNGVKAVSFSTDAPSSSNDWSTNFYFNNSMKDPGFDIYLKQADTAYFNTYQLSMVAGKIYSASDTLKEVVVNETLCHKLGIAQPEAIVGKTIRLGGKWYPISGVVKDFKASSLKEEMRPIALFSRRQYYSTIGIKLAVNSLSNTLPVIQQLWERTYPDYVYNSSFLDERIARFYEQETQLTILYKLFAIIAIFISCLGIYGLISFLTIQKTKEVGIRKTLGASVQSIVLLFSKEFTLLVIIAFGVAAPIGWWLMHHWLQHFVYRIPIEGKIFILAICISLLIAWLTVSYKAVKAALVKPVKSLQTN